MYNHGHVEKVNPLQLIYRERTRINQLIKINARRRLCSMRRLRPYYCLWLLLNIVKMLQRVFCIYYLNLFWMCSWNKMVTCKATYSMLQYRIFYIQVLDTENFISRILCKQRSLSCQTYLIVYHHFIVKEKFFDILIKSHPSIINLDLCTINN